MSVKPSQQVEVNTFIGGLNTEASPLNYPANSSADELNFDLFRDGSRRRRLGMDFETSYSLVDTGLIVYDLNAAGYNSFRWLQAGGSPDANFVVFQIANKLFFFDESTAPISGSLVGTIEITEFAWNVVYSLTSVEGFLIMASGKETIGVVQYNPITKTFSLTFERLLIRDLWGIEETVDVNYENDVSYRGTTDSPQHRYNLYNQSWGIPRKNGDGALINPVDNFKKDLSKYPSNSEQVWAGMQMQAVAFSTVSTQQPFERQFTNLYDDALGSKTVAAKGYFIIDALRRGQGRQDAASANTSKYNQMTLGLSFPADYSPNGAKCVSEFAGRVFYAGFGGSVTDGDARSPNLANYVFYSQLIKSRSDIYKCYQEGDPTSRDSSDLIDTDGGFVRISGAQNIISLHNLGIYLVVIAENGVWAITGGDTNSGFTATNYKVTKISSFGGLSSSSVVVDGDVAYYWAQDGIYQIGKDQYGDLKVQNVTIASIQKLYQAIPNLAKTNCFGAYDPVNKKIRWVYKDGTLFQSDSVTRELVLDTALSNFTLNQINNLDDYSVEIVGVFQTPLLAAISQDEIVYVKTDDVYQSLDLVLSDVRRYTSQTQYLRYFTLKNISDKIYLTLSYFGQEEFLDWKSVDGVGKDAKAYCLTGAITAGDSALDKQVPYIFVTMAKTEGELDSSFMPTTPSGCLMRTQWSFANAAYSNKWSPLVQVYRPRKLRMDGTTANPWDIGFDVITSKNKTRGRGKAIAVYFETEAGKDCHILGWHLVMNAIGIA